MDKKEKLYYTCEWCGMVLDDNGRCPYCGTCEGIVQEEPEEK